jgi:hypothetical protein
LLASGMSSSVEINAIISSSTEKLYAFNQDI